MKQMMRRILMAAVVLALTSGVATAQITNFSQDVNGAIDDGLDFVRSTYWTPALEPIGSFGGIEEAHGLLGLAIMEKHATADFSSPILGYSNSSAADKTRLENLTRVMIADGNHVSRGSFYAYTDGIDMMYLSLYARTGGPEPAGAIMTIRQAMDMVVDRTLANQGPASGVCGTKGMWSYTSCGQDSSTTQFAAGGLAGALGYYLETMDPGGRIPLINAALPVTRQGYAENQVANGGFPAADFGRGWGYQVPGSNASYQQTASGLWATELGGATVNTLEVQDGLKWQRTRYNYETVASWGDGFEGLSYGYFIFSSAKAYTLLEDQGIAPAAGNLDTDDIGTLAADPAMGRLAQRSPAVDPCARTAFAAECHGPYTSEDPRWYYDYAYTIMSRQLAAGNFNIVNGSWDDTADQAYHILVLERSLAGACVDTDLDGVCDDVDNCPTIANPDQSTNPCNENPVCSAATPSMGQLWPANNGLQNVSILGVTDADGDTITIVMNSVRSDESSSLSTAGGVPDAFIMANGSADLRRQRGATTTNPGNGRVYYLAFTANDGNGGSCQGAVQVNVPRTPATGTVADGPNFDATAP